MHEDIPILNFLVPKEFTHENGRLTGVLFEKVKAEYDAKGRRKLVPTGEPDQHFPCDDVLVAVGQENAFPWIERDIGIEFDKWDMPKVDPSDHASTHPKVFFGGDARSARRTSSGRSRTATTPRCRSTSCARRGHQRAPAADGRDRQPEDGHPRVELRQRHRARPALPGAAARQGRSRCATSRSRSSSASTSSSRSPRRSAASTATCRPCSPRRCASSATPASTSARWTASPSPRTARKPTCARACGRRPRTSPGPLRRRRSQDRPRHGEGRGRLPALRAVRRALPDRRLGHAEVPHRHDARG